MPQAPTNPSRFRIHHLWITHTGPTLFVKLDIFHNAFDDSGGIITHHVDHDVFRAKILDTWNIWAIE